MLGRLREVLANAGVELSEEELLDALWLAGTLPCGTGPVARAAVGAEPGPSPEAPDPTASARPDNSDTEQQLSQETAADPTERPLHVRAEQPAGHAAEARAHGARVPDTRVMEASDLRSGRSLRPLRQRFPDLRRPELDVARTVAAMAETGLPVTVTRPQRTRWLSLALVVDDGVSMVLWQRLASEIRKLMERAGAFRDVRVYGLDTRTAGAPSVSARPYLEGGPRRPPVSLSDPTGETLVLVVSDGVGEAWRDGRMRQAVDQWARCGPTAVVHTLPTRLWRGSGIAARTWHVRSHRRGGPTADWRVSDPVLPSGLADFASVPVPVLEPTPSAVAAWARLLAAPGAGALLPLWSDGRAPSPPAPAEQEADTVLRFRAAATPEAYRLAAHLAAVAPVTPPVMRLVGGALGKQIDSGHLAEVFLGGLMHQIGPPPADLPPHQRQFDFAPEIRSGLLGALAPHELLRTTREVAERLEAAVGRSPDFPAWVGHPGGSALITDGEPSFGWMTDRLLGRLGVPPAGPTSDDRSAAAEADSSAATAGATSSAAAPAVEPIALSPDWTPIDPPARLGGFTLIAQNRRGWNALSLYLAWGPNGELATVRTTERLYEADPDMARAIIHTEAECLRRMQGESAPALLDWQAAPGSGAPWLAAACARSGTAADAAPAANLQDLYEGDGAQVPAERFLQIGRGLAAAVSRAHRLGLVHGAMTPRSVLATDDGVQLIGWITASIDGRHSRYRAGFQRNRLYVAESSPARALRREGDPTVAPELVGVPGPTVEGDMYSVGAVLIALATGRWHEVRPDTATMAAAASAGPDPDVTALLWRCLSPEPAGRPTADELLEAFDLISPAPPESIHLRSEDLAVVRREVDRLRTLASQDPNRFSVPLARALVALADRSAETGLAEAACEAGNEAVQVLRGLAEGDPPAFLPELGRSLNNVAVRLREAGRPVEALAAAVEAVALLRAAQWEDPALRATDVALALTNLSNLLAEAGRPAEALEPAGQAVEIYQSKSVPVLQRSRPERARALNNLANRLGDVGRTAEALDAATDAVKLYREAARRQPDTAVHELATALDNLAVRLGALGRYDDARSAHAEGLSIWHTLTGTPHHRHADSLRSSELIGVWLEEAAAADE
ncbi:SAV_2336 N-terminal domain-related protein [Kitasatospora sp. NPDC048365]|uniref:SAV_2336 N-terminal domain-related protein n=1 Tax=Kitasatospora sp. NPDC048365 TaxID=3364050 RepID=UPI003715967E